MSESNPISGEFMCEVETVAPGGDPSTRRRCRFEAEYVSCGMLLCPEHAEDWAGNGDPVELLTSSNGPTKGDDT